MQIKACITKSLTLVSFALFLAPSYAQTMYRCGKVFQDKPCDAGTPGKIVGSTSVAPTSSQGSPVGDPLCAERANKAKHIVWARETGRTKDDQLSATKNEDERRLVEEVYLIRGRADETAAAIAAKCIRDKEQALLADRIAAQLTKPQAATTEVHLPSEAQAKLEEKNQRCQSIEEELRHIQLQEHAGGSASRLDDLRARKRKVENNRQKEGC